MNNPIHQGTFSLTIPLLLHQIYTRKFEQQKITVYRCWRVFVWIIPRGLFTPRIKHEFITQLSTVCNMFHTPTDKYDRIFGRRLDTKSLFRNASFYCFDPSNSLNHKYLHTCIHIYIHMLKYICADPVTPFQESAKYSKMLTLKK